MKFASLFTALCVAAGIGVFVALGIHPPLFADAQSYVFYCGNTSSNCREIKTTQAPALYKLFLSDLNGEAAVYSSDFDVEKFLQDLSASILFEEQLSDSVNLYCSADLPYSVNLYGQEVNLHIVIKSDSILVASPIAFGGY